MLQKLYQTILENSSRIKSVFNPPLRSRSMQGSWKNAAPPTFAPSFLPYPQVKEHAQARPKVLEKGGGVVRPGAREVRRCR
jgi:hypothetical protein